MSGQTHTAAATAAVADALASIAPADIVVGVRWIDDADIARLHPGESAVVRNAVLTRRREFATGRVLLRELTGVDAPILRGADRAPLLPPGWRGSLAHDDELAVAAVVDSPSIAAVGIDVEPATPLAEDMAAMIQRPEESSIDAHLAFVLKEASYKAWSALGGRILEHHDVSLTLDGARFRARVLDDDTLLDGMFTTVASRYLALVVVPAYRAPTRR